MRRARVKISAAVAAALVALLLVPGAVSPAAAFACRASGSMETVTLRTFTIEAKVRKASYRIGETAVFDASVTRPAEEDPFGAGIPTAGIDPQPAADVNVGVGLLIGNVFLPGFAITDADGKATIKVKMEKYVKPGPVDAAFYAWKVQADTPCLRVEENGFRPFPSMFTVKS